MTDRGSHSAYLPVLSFDEFESDPARRDRFAHANRWNAGRDVRRWLEPLCTTRQGPPTLNHHTTLELLERLDRRLTLDLDPVLARMRMPRIQQGFVERRFVR